MVSRRNFVKGAGFLPLLTATDLSFTGSNENNNKPQWTGPAIKSITILKGTGNFNRFIAQNAYDTEPKGIKGTNSFVKVTLEDGTEGLGGIGYVRPTEEVYIRLKELLGKDPLAFYTWKGDQITGVATDMQPIFYDTKYCWIESAILDAVGKLKKAPVWKLFGESVRDGIDPYDGTVYFEDIAANKSVGIIAETAKLIKNEGYRAIKIKLGRPSKWLKGEAGVVRDIDAFIALREAVGNNFTLLADANNGYQNQFDWAVRLLKETAPYDMFFMEELFPDNAAMYHKLRQELLKDNFFVKIAEGENIHNLELFDQYGKDGCYHFIQPDMQTCGMSYILKTARNAEKYPHVKLIPHVWQSQVGLIMSMHISKIQHNIPYVEDSRYFEHVLYFSGYEFKDGQYLVTDKPGWGIELAPLYEKSLTDKPLVIS